MVKLATVAVALGIVAGSWVILMLGFGSLTTWSPVVLAVAVLLVLGSILSLVGPKKVFYGSALLSAAQAGVLSLESNLTDFFTLVALGLSGGTFLLCILAARWETKVSEQSNPMNLPVFG